MGLFDLFNNKKTDAELLRLKEEKRKQDWIRITELESKYVSPSDAALLAELPPTVRLMVRNTLIQCKQAGIHLGIHTGYRSVEAQDELYKIGRKLENGLWVVSDKAKIVTNAIGGKSWHNYGLAADLVIDGSEKPGLQWTWDDTVDTNKDGLCDWNQMGIIAEHNGLTWGGRWRPPVAPKDDPHVQYHNGIDTVSQALILYKQGGLDAVWNKIA